MAFQTSYNDVGGTGQTTSPKLQARDLPSKRLLGKGLASIGYETEWNEVRCARKDFIEVPSVIFEAEAAALVRLKGHENVVQTLGWTVDKMSCSLLLEYMDDDLLSLLQQRKESRRGPAGTESCAKLPAFELQEALEIMLQTARGMENLHEQGILHGDLKTNNILVSQMKDGDKKTLSVKVADFGLLQTKRKSIPFVSRQVRKLDMVQWKAPEYFKRLSSHALEDNDETSSDSDSDLDEECTSVSLKNNDRLLLQPCDVYSFAVSCSQILTGKKPYPNLNWKELGAKIVEGDLRPELPAACPTSLRDLLVQCWDKAPAKRPNFSIIRSKLEDLLAPAMINQQNPVGILKSETMVAEQHADDIKKDCVRFLNSTGETITFDCESKATTRQIFALEAGQHCDQEVFIPSTDELFRVVDSTGKKTEAAISMEKLNDGVKQVTVTKDGNTYKLTAIPRYSALGGNSNLIDWKAKRVFSVEESEIAMANSSSKPYEIDEEDDDQKRDITSLDSVEASENVVAMVKTDPDHTKQKSEVASQGCELNVVGDEPASSFSERNKDFPHAALSTTTVRVNHEPGVLMVDKSNTAESEYVLEAKHKVYLSYSGAQKDFVEQLCVDLERCDRYPFFDKLRSSLPIGEKFPKLIFDAIEQCQVGVVVLSEEFLMKNKWPMLELNAMVNEIEKPKSMMNILPVWYGISVHDSKDISNQRRWMSQWKDWANKDKRINVEEWMQALRILQSINGFVMSKGMGDVQFRREIVAGVCGLISCESRWDDSHIQGRARICGIICNMIARAHASSEVCVVGLYGTSGIGKTTICKALCNYLNLQFHDKVCHVELESASEMELLKMALMNLTYINNSILDNLHDIDQGYFYLRKQLVTRPVFLALDNVRDDYEAIKIAESYLKANYGCGSVLLVTARSLDVLMRLNLDASNCFEMPELEKDEATSLFLYYVDLPTENEVDEALIEQCIRRCYFSKGDGKSMHYHPLALKVLAQQIGATNSLGWTEKLWKMDMFNQLGNEMHPVFSILRETYNSLRSEHQLVFMDLALLLPDDNGWTREWSSLVWLCAVHEEAIDYIKDSLEVLKRKSLLQDLSGDFAKIGMHDLWREFAVLETKAQDSTNQRWVYQVDGKRAALGRSGRFRESVDRMCFLNEGWKGLNGLNLDDFVNVEVFKFDVEIHMADCALDLDLSGLKHLKSLHLNTPGLTVRADGLSALTNLHYLMWNTPGFSPCLDKIGRFRNLQVLGLEDCKGVEVLDLTELRVLRVVVITEFPDLITVRGLSSRLAFIRCLRINGCKSLRECPGVGELYALEELNLQKCGKLEELPWLGRLTELRMLHIHGCKSIAAVPGLSYLAALEYLHVMECWKLAMLPDLGNLRKLQVLHLDSAFEEVSGLDGLISLTTLVASFGKLMGEKPIFAYPSYQC